MAGLTLLTPLGDVPPADWLLLFPERHHPRIIASYHRFVNLYRKTFPLSCLKGFECNGKECGSGNTTCMVSLDGKLKKTKSRVCSSHNILVIQDKESSTMRWNYDLIAYWNWEENSHIINPLLLAPSSIRFYVFSCPYADCDCHVFDSIMYNFTAGTRCPFCVGKKICAHNNAAVRLPEVLEWWDYEKNSVTPYDIPARTNKKYWFRCPRVNCECHTFHTTMNNFNCGLRCQFCARQKVCMHYNGEE